MTIRMGKGMSIELIWPQGFLLHQDFLLAEKKTVQLFHGALFLLFPKSSLNSLRVKVN